ncbi:MAG: hypothetical protein IJI22_02020 [Bacilli bacterium]|nr:hypothetical protein [Bacilli bacterium]
MALIFLYHQKLFIGVKGRVQSRVVEAEDKKEYLMEIIAEKVTFLSSKKEKTD